MHEGARDASAGASPTARSVLSGCVAELSLARIGGTGGLRRVLLQLRVPLKTPRRLYLSPEKDALGRFVAALLRWGIRRGERGRQGCR